MLRLAPFAALLLAGAVCADETDDLLKDLRTVKAEGVNSAAARGAWDRLVRQGPAALPRIPNGGTIASSSGSATVAPNPRRTVRLGNVFEVRNDIDDLS